jgi:arylsulfatase A-like enzyme
MVVVLLGLAGLQAASDVAGDTEPSLPKRPNVVLIVTDDQRWDTLQYMPAVQRLLVARGVTFTNAFTITPVCQPSRASLLTGRYADRTGVPSNVGDTPRGFFCPSPRRGIAVPSRP